jgi:uncharacterized damage-inducible protein DinB
MSCIEQGDKAQDRQTDQFIFAQRITIMEFVISEVIRILEATPAILTAWLGNLPVQWLMANNGEGTWSPYDIVGHLIHGEKTDWIPRAEIILSDRENREFEPFDRFAMFEESQEKSINELLDEFNLLRKGSLERLQALHPTVSDYEKTGIHPTLGEVTLRQLLSTWAVHDLNHLGQIAQVMARQYKVEVGPWRGFLEIIDR